MPDHECDTCGATVDAAEASQSAPYGDRDDDHWQTLCCPSCGARLEIVFVPA